jgi:hypothetical protein
MKRSSPLPTKPIWTYGIQIWGTAYTSNIEILERFQSKDLRMRVDALGMSLIHSSKGISTSQQSQKKSAATALIMVLLHTHPNHLAVNLLGLLTTDASTVSAY